MKKPHEFRPVTDQLERRELLATNVLSKVNGGAAIAEINTAFQTFNVSYQNALNPLVQDFQKSAADKKAFDAANAAGPFGQLFFVKTNPNDPTKQSLVPVLVDSHGVPILDANGNLQAVSNPQAAKDKKQIAKDTQNYILALNTAITKLGNDLSGAVKGAGLPGTVTSSVDTLIKAQITGASTGLGVTILPAAGSLNKTLESAGIADATSQAKGPQTGVKKAIGLPGSSAIDQAYTAIVSTITQGVDVANGLAKAKGHKTTTSSGGEGSSHHGDR